MKYIMTFVPNAERKILAENGEKPQAMALERSAERRPKTLAFNVGGIA